MVLLLLAKHLKSLIASSVIATLPPPSVVTTMGPTTGQFELLGFQVIEPTLEHYLHPEKMTFYPFFGYIYKNCKNIVNAFPENSDHSNLKYYDWTKAAALVKLYKSENAKKVVCSYQSPQCAVMSQGLW